MSVHVFSVEKVQSVAWETDDYGESQITNSGHWVLLMNFEGKKSKKKLVSYFFFRRVN